MDVVAEPVLPAVDLAPVLNRRFSALMLGVPVLATLEMTEAEQQVLRRLGEALVQRKSQDFLPRMPAVLPRLMGLVRRDNVSAREITEQVARDPALMGEVIRLANSSYYRRGKEIADLQDAVMTLGQMGLEKVIVQAAMRPVFNAQQGRFSRTATALLWDLSARCAAACSFLMKGQGQEFNAYLAGTLLGCGLLPTLRILDQSFATGPAPQSQAFHDGLSEVGLKIAAQLARDWEFPAEVAQAIASLSMPASPATDSTLGAALREADQVSKLQLLPGGQAEPEALLQDLRLMPSYQWLDRSFAAAVEPG
ncbi:MAG: HDOD domain-containing protein [Paucibacter sp.]|nr:HDOD domain-containing protein [Roseateles sp.]